MSEDRLLDQASVNHRLGGVDAAYRWEGLGARGPLIYTLSDLLSWERELLPAGVSRYQGVNKGWLLCQYTLVDLCSRARTRDSLPKIILTSQQTRPQGGVSVFSVGDCLAQQRSLYPQARASKRLAGTGP